MVFKRTAVLTEEEETKLAQQMLPLWNSDPPIPAKEITRKLNFGVPETEYAKLKKHSVFYYRLKFNNPVSRLGKVYKHLKRFEGKFPRRREGAFGKSSDYEKKNRYKNKKKKVMTFQTFKEGLETIPITEEFGSGYSRLIRRKRAYLILHFWTPLRKSEIYERTINDFDFDEGFLEINLYRKKKFYAPGADTEPFYLETNLNLVSEVVDWIFSEEWREPLRDEKGKLIKNIKGEQVLSKRPFNFTGWTAWNYVKSTFPTFYPHFFRSNYITRSIKNIKDPGRLISELLKDTGLDIQTIERYIMKNRRFRGALNRRQLEVMKAHGMA